MKKYCIIMDMIQKSSKDQPFYYKGPDSWTTRIDEACEFNPALQSGDFITNEAAFWLERPEFINGLYQIITVYAPR